MVHKTTEFKRAEIDGAMKALHLSESVDLVQVVEDVNWRAVRIDRSRGDRKGVPAPFPVCQGIAPETCRNRGALVDTRFSQGVGEKGSYFQGSRSTRRPIRLVRHAGHGP